MAAPGLLKGLGDDCLDVVIILDVAGQDQVRRTDRFPASGLDALAEGFALIGEGQFGALRAQRRGDAPGDRMVIGHAHDQAALAGH